MTKSGNRYGILECSQSILHKALDMAVLRTKKYGFFPFTFAPDLKGKDPGKQIPAHSLRLAYYAVALSNKLKYANPKLVEKLLELAVLQIGQEKYRKVANNLEMYSNIRDRSYLEAT